MNQLDTILQFIKDNLMTGIFDNCYNHPIGAVTVEHQKCYGADLYSFYHNQKSLFNVVVDEEDAFDMYHSGVHLYDRGLLSEWDINILAPVDKELKRKVEYQISDNECFVVDYTSEEAIFQQTLLHNFNPKDMEYIFNISDILQKYVIKERSMCLSFTGHKIFELYAVLELELSSVDTK